MKISPPQSALMLVPLQMRLGRQFEQTSPPQNDWLYVYASGGKQHEPATDVLAEQTVLAYRPGNAVVPK